MRLYDEDGIDGPFNNAMRSAMREDDRKRKEGAVQRLNRLLGREDNPKHGLNPLMHAAADEISTLRSELADVRAEVKLLLER